jgi:hypothetical protein
VIAGDGSPELALDMTVAVGTTATALIGMSAGASSSRPQIGAASATVVADNNIMEEPEVIHGHPLLRAPGDVSPDEAMGTAQWALNQA